MALKARAETKKPAGKRPRRTMNGEGKSAEEKAQAAEFTRLVNGFEARVQEIDAALAAAIKRLSGR